MTDFADIAGADDDLRRALIEEWADIPEDIREELFRLGSAHVPIADRLPRSAELVYARMDELPANKSGKLRAAVARALRSSVWYGFHGLREEQRGARMAAILEGAKDVPIPAPRRDLLNRERRDV